MTDFLSFIIDPLRAVLDSIHSVIYPTVPYAWGFSIIILTIIIRIFLIPLTVKQYTSMRSMQRLQPHIKALQKKYKDDRQKMNEELMKFYRENKVNPFGSCLPLLLQMPIFLALFYMLRNEPFTPDPSFFWIDDISLSDPYKILVFLFIGTQFLSSKLMSTSVDKSQQMMLLMMPIVFGVMFLFMDFPAGVLIYWVTTNIWSVGQQLSVMKILKAREGDEPEPVVVDDTPAKKLKKKQAKSKSQAKAKEKSAGKTGGKNVGKSKQKSKSGSKSGSKSK
jgi:YidC/Oxa1 family membrane protein insertase